MYASTSYVSSRPIRLAVVVVAAAAAAALGVQDDQASAAVGVRQAGVPGIVSTIAGGPGGPGSARRVAITVCGKFISQGGCGFSFAAGNLYVTDLGWPNSSGDVVRQVNIRTGHLITVAGDAQPGFGGDGGPATQAQISELNDASVDAAGNLLVTDGISVRVVPARSGTFYGKGMTVGHIYTVAGGGTSTQDGVPATAASIRPRGATIDHSGNLVICGSSALRVVAASTGTFYGRAMTAGDIYTVAGGGASGQDGVPATTAAMTPYAVAIDEAGNLLLPDPRAGRLRVVAVSTGRFYGQPMTAGDIYTIAGGGSSHRDGIRATRALLTPFGLAIDRSGNLVEADYGTARVRVVAVRTGRFYGRAMTGGHIYTVAGGGTSKGNGVLATAAMLRHPHALAVDSAGNIAIGDQLSNLVRVVAARTGTFYGVPVRAGHLYFVAGNGRTWSSGAGALATRAQFFPALPITFDQGNLVVPETHATSSSLNTSVRLVPARSGSFFGMTMRAGHLYRIAGNGGDIFSGNGTPARKSGIGQIFGVAADSHGNVVLADSDNYRLLVIAARNGRFYGRAMRTGRIYSIAGNGKFGFSGDGGPAVKAKIEPGFPRIDQDGNVIFGQNPRIRLVADRTGTFYGVPMTAGDIYTIAGGTQGTGGDGGPALNAQFELINGVTRDGTNGVLVSDQYRIRMIATANGTFFGVPMTAGDIYTVAGTGNQGTADDGVPALAADISPQALAVDSARNLIFYDEGVNKVRVVAATSGTFYGVPMTANHIYTIVGGGTGSLGDGGPGTQATINFVTGLAVNGQGLAFTDGQDNRVRMIQR